MDRAGKFPVIRAERGGTFSAVTPPEPIHVQRRRAAPLRTGRVTSLRRALKSWMHAGVASVTGKFT